MKKKLSAIVLSAVLLSSLAACGGGKTNEGASPSGNADTNASNANTSSNGKKAVITIIQNKVEIQEQLEAAVKEFNGLQDQVEVQTLGIAGDNLTTVLQTQFGSAPEKAPTIFTTASGSEFEKFLPYMAELGDTKAASRILEGQDKSAIKDGKLYGLPVALEGFGLIYNKDLFKQAGVDPAAIKSIDDLVEASKKLEQQDGVKHAIAFAEESYFRFMHFFNWPFALMNNTSETIGKINAGELKIQDIPEMKAFAADLDKLKPYTNLSKNTYDEQVAGFAEGQFAMIHQGNWAQNLLNDYKVSFEYGFLPFPLNGNEGISIGNSNFFRVNKHASEEQQKGAKAFLDWLITDPAGQRYVTEEFKLIPVYSGFDTSKMDPLSQEVNRYASEDKAVPWVFDQFPAGAHQDFANEMEKYYSGKVNSEGLLEGLEKVWMNAVK
ncbi:ABC transporter substrate-binding protein [Paenibacillus guangzhouensis]|uniref:ABC transporter substrate-binding protein n=1 Tax=Paenibacillus guangzhouensis TaxID=1473112 RepID=UPI00187B6EA9|nr:extracellular solute-binding protein [Paenibacillus guangzhouensis]